MGHEAAAVIEARRPMQISVSAGLIGQNDPNFARQRVQRKGLGPEIPNHLCFRA
jgi:hypothetical protein